MVALCCAACASAPPEPTLYQRLGGSRVDQAVGGRLFVANGRRIRASNGRFKGLDAPGWPSSRQPGPTSICDARGGPCAYLGRDMKTTHTGMGITDARVERHRRGSGQVGSTSSRWGQKEQQELLSALGAMKKDIVGQ